MRCLPDTRFRQLLAANAGRLDFFVLSDYSSSPRFLTAELLLRVMITNRCKEGAGGVVEQPQWSACFVYARRAEQVSESAAACSELSELAVCSALRLFEIATQNVRPFRTDPSRSGSLRRCPEIINASFDRGTNNSCVVVDQPTEHRRLVAVLGQAARLPSADKENGLDGASG